jgi:hypothetical protein
MQVKPCSVVYKKKKAPDINLTVAKIYLRPPTPNMS